MIDEKKLEDIRRRMPPRNHQVKDITLSREDMDEWHETVESLWKENAELKIRDTYRTSPTPWLVGELERLEKLNAAVVDTEMRNVAYIQKLEVENAELKADLQKAIFRIADLKIVARAAHEYHRFPSSHARMDLKAALAALKQCWRSE